MAVSPNVPELCRTWACVHANAERVTRGDLALGAAFVLAVIVVFLWPEPHR